MAKVEQVAATLFAHRREAATTVRWQAAPLLVALVLAALILSLTVGAVPIPPDDVLRALLGLPTSDGTYATIVLVFRLPKAITALLAGAALAVAGLQMQTVFRNPLADPFVLGISSGASLGVALVVMGSATSLAGVSAVPLLSRVIAQNALGVLGAASLGAAAAFGLVMMLSQRLQNIVALLVLGLMFGYAVSAIVSILIAFSLPEQIQAYLNWTFGSFGGVTWSQMPVFAGAALIGLIATGLGAKPLNALLLGENYARSLGVNVRRVRYLVMAASSLLAGAVAAFCGPIGFLGVAVPHLARGLLRTSDHRVLVPFAALLGGALALIFDLIAQMPGAPVALPLNSVTALIGAPVVAWVILRRRRVMV